MKKINLFFVIIYFLTSCTSTEKLRKEMVYFNGGFDSAAISSYSYSEPIIQKGDILQIKISTRSASSNQLFALNYGPSPSEESASGGLAVTSLDEGYLVDMSSGDLHLPLLGTIHADGMTKNTLVREITKRVIEFVQEAPIVNIRLMNFRVTFLGSVRQPGTKIFQSERITILQALGEAGGIEPGGDLKNIQLIREQNGKRVTESVDLTKGDFFNSSNYFLKQNDVIYIRPTERQMLTMDQTSQRRLQWVSLGISFINIFFLIFNILR